MAIHSYNCGSLTWTLTGWHPFEWQIPRDQDLATGAEAQVHPIPAQVPGSVQQALRAAGLLPDWTVGLNAQACEWVEQRHWVFATHLPDEWCAAPDTQIELHAEGLDGAGWLFCNGQQVATFTNAFVPHAFDLTPFLQRAGANRLEIVFDCPPRWLGQFGRTSQMTEAKPRFNYTWDWTPRLVQIGLWDALTVRVTDGQVFGTVHWVTDVTPFDDASGTLWVQGTVVGEHGTQVRLTLQEVVTGHIVRTHTYPCAQLATGLRWDDLPIALWWPNGAGAQPLYHAQLELLAPDGAVLDTHRRRVGFKSIVWEACAGAPDGADPWLCVVNGQPLFLQGINWTPIRPNFADVSEADYAERLQTYRDLGCNLMRVWGGGFLETETFYDRCDELGFLVWQEFPLSSSGVENVPPADPVSLNLFAGIALSYVTRRRHHVALLLWCGGNELQALPGDGAPVTTAYPLIDRLAQVVATHDPGRRFLPTSPSGPRFAADAAEMDRGLHWDVHGPWIPVGAVADAWRTYWQQDDALFRSEVGAPGASGAALIRAYAGDLPTFPVGTTNPLWRRMAWWDEVPQFIAEHGREPSHLEEYVAWSQQRQAEALAIAAAACKGRFPQCGGFIVWMGHDAFPCPNNTSILDFHGHPKPAAFALQQIFQADPRQVAGVLAHTEGHLMGIPVEPDRLSRE